MAGFKKVTIRNILARKMKYWLMSITDEKVRKIAEQNAIITGGAITSLLQGEKPNDYDVYFKTKEAVIAVTRYYLATYVANNQFKNGTPNPINPELREETRTNIKGEEEERVVIYIKSAGVTGEGQSEYRYFECEHEIGTAEFVESLAAQEGMTLVKYKKGEELPSFRPRFMTDNAITLANDMQLIIRFWGQPEDIHRNYDFIHTTCSYDHALRKVDLPQAALESIMSKSLIYSGSLYPLASMFRLRKFIKRGWRITAGQMLKIAHQLSTVDFNDRAMLREQLVGVDAAYMEQLLNALDKHEGAIDGAYISQLIDRIFEE